MDRERFKGLVARAIAALPDEFISKLENIDVVAEDYPTQSQLTSVGLRRGQSAPPTKDWYHRTK